MDDEYRGNGWYAAGGSGEAAGADGGLDLRGYLHVLLKYKWGILSVAFLAALIGLYAAFRAVPIYESRATLQIERDAGPALGDLVRMQTFPVEFYQTQYELIRSWSVAEMAAERLGLLEPDRLAQQQGASAAGGFDWRALLPDFLQDRAPQPTPEVRRRLAIGGIRKSIAVVPVPKSELTSVVVQHRDPEWAAQVANAVAGSYVDFLRDRTLSDITGNQSWYASRLAKARADLEQAEAALQDFMDRQGLIQTADGVDVLQSQALQAALTNRGQARQQKLALQRLYREIQAADGPADLQSITALEGRGIVRQLRNDFAAARRNVAQLAERYGPRHPRMIEAQAQLASSRQAYRDELQAVAEAVVADYQRAVRTEASYTRQLEEAQADIQQINRNRAELSKLQDDVKTSRALFEQLQSGEKTAGLLEGGLQNVNATVIEQARAGLYPVRPDKRQMVLLWALGGLFVGVGLAFLLEHLDNTFKSSEEVERRLELPVLGQLQHLKVGRNEGLAPMRQFVEQSRSAFAEAVRTIRTGVLLSAVDRARSVVAVTSSVPGEGKTTLALNLAHALARMKKTLLIEADMRRPIVRKVVAMEKSRPGLAALVTGEATLDEVREVTAEGLHVIPCGTVPPNPLELLSSNRLRDLLETLRQEYEFIVIDSAPALAVSDALVVSNLADMLLYVVRADATPVQAAEEGLKRLRRVDAPLLGCVLNQVVTGRHYGYGKYRGYHRYARYAWPGVDDYAYAEYAEDAPAR